MADVFTHVLVGYIIGTLLSIRYRWIRPEHVTLVMLGALSPDLTKISLVVSDATVATVLGIPFSWTPLHTPAGNAIVLALGTLLVPPGHRKRTLALLAIGALSHHGLDLLLISTTGYSYAVFWPLTDYRFPRGGLYLSSDRWPLFVAGVVATSAWALRYRWSGSSSY